MQVEEAVAVSAEVATHVTQDDSCCLAVIMVVTHGLWIEEEEINLLSSDYLSIFFIVCSLSYRSHHLLLLSIFAHPATGGQPVDMVLVQHTQ